MLIAGQEVVYVARVLRMLTQYSIHHMSFCCSAKINVCLRDPLCSKTSWFRSLSKLTQAVLEMIA